MGQVATRRETKVKAEVEFEVEDGTNNPGHHSKHILKTPKNFKRLLGKEKGWTGPRGFIASSRVVPGGHGRACMGARGIGEVNVKVRVPQQQQQQRSKGESIPFVPRRVESVGGMKLATAPNGLGATMHAVVRSTTEYPCPRKAHVFQRIQPLQKPSSPINPPLHPHHPHPPPSPPRGAPLLPHGHV